MKLQHLFEVDAAVQERFAEWQRDCRRENENCQFAGSVTMGAQAVDWTSSNNRAIGDWDPKTMTGKVYAAADAIGTRAQALINSEFYVYDEHMVSPDKYDCTVEEAKAQYRITVTPRGIFVDADRDTGANPRRARTIRDRLNRILNPK